MTRSLDLKLFRLISVWASLIVSVAVSAAYAAPLSDEDPDMFEDRVIALLENVAADWNASNYDALKSYWDETDPMPLYLAEESDLIMTNWEDVERYWTASQQWINWIHVDYSNYQIKQVDASHAIAAFDLRFDLQLNDRPRPIGGDNRAVVNLRKIDGDWKIHAWVEAPLSAATYVRKLYELNVRDDLPERASPDQVSD